MDYEKAYKEALERARYLKENADSVGALDVSAGFEYIFHELRESEDEKIRKDIIVVIEKEATRVLKETGNIPVWYEGAISWLEKQGEQKPKVDLGNKFEWHNIPEETPKFGDTVIVACKNKNKEGGIWLYDLIQCWEGKWEPRENWETPLKWISVDELGLNARKEK